MPGSAKTASFAIVAPDARGVVGRFATTGGNELIFEQKRNQAHRPDNEPVRVGGSRRGAKAPKTDDLA